MSQCPAWSFNLDNVYQWAYWDKAFTAEECEKIIEEGLENKLKIAAVGTDNEKKVNEKIRKSNVSWINPTEENNWIFKRLTSIVLDLNIKYFRFDLFGIIEPLQFTEYQTNNGHYVKHVDRNEGIVVRKLSLSVQLTDSEDYMGGNLILHTDSKGTEISRDQGYLALFPSYTLHEVTPVTQGTRHSLVAWVTGKNFT